MKKYVLLITILFFSSAFVTQAQFISRPSQGGTGIGTTTIANEGNCLKVASTTPFLIYELGTCGGGAGSSTTINGLEGPFTFTGTGIGIATSSGPATVTFTNLRGTTTIAGIGGTVTIATGTDTNLHLRVTTSSQEITFTPVWIGTLDISDRTNLGVSTPITLVGDVIGFASDWWQALWATSTPSFAGLTLTGRATTTDIYNSGLASTTFAYFDRATTTNLSATTATTTDLYATGGISFLGEVMPDGIVCSNGQILKKTGANDWDCAADNDTGGGTSAFVINGTDAYGTTTVTEWGIGTTTPSGLFHVATGSVNALYVGADGTVGIGTSTPNFLSGTGLVITASNTIGAVFATSSHLVFSNPNASAQTSIAFIATSTKEVLGGVRVDSEGNFNWQGKGPQGHQFYNSIDGALPVAGFSKSGVIVGGIAGATSRTTFEVIGLSSTTNLWVYDVASTTNFRFVHATGTKISIGGNTITHFAHPTSGLAMAGTSLKVGLGGNATQTCSGTDKVSAITATGTITCSADVDTGGVGDSYPYQPLWATSTPSFAGVTLTGRATTTDIYNSGLASTTFLFAGKVTSTDITNSGLVSTTNARINVGTTTQISILGQTASRILQTAADGVVTAVANLANWIAGSTGLTVADDGDGTISLNLDNDLGDIAGLTPTKGDLITTAGTDWTDFAVGTDGFVLMASSAATNGVAWMSTSTLGLGGSGATDGGRSLTITGNTVDADAELYTDSFSFVVSAPNSSDDNILSKGFPLPITITEVGCSTDTATTTFQMDERNENTPNTAGTAVLSAYITCGNATTATTTSFANAGIAANSLLSLSDIATTTGTPNVLRVTVKFTWDD